MSIKFDNFGFCPKCDSLNDVDVKDTIDRNVCEAETTCSSCGHIDYWAYGWYQSKTNEEG